MKVINLKEYKDRRVLKKQISELDRLGDQQYHLMNPEEQKGYQNWQRLLKALDEQYGDEGMGVE